MLRLALPLARACQDVGAVVVGKWAASRPHRAAALYPDPASPNLLGYAASQGPLFGGKSLNATDCAVAPKLYHVLVALKHYKVSGAGQDA